ncbi:chemotaxis protein CheB [Mangrovicoccus algicola]|uniref:PAS domain-containing protein n=1 Tax=Mangrovicoccus algicola TaxID=2771008 RepID=A0A8J6YYI3_9RHOB|nr:chemotaxis protein CheB [Mangrovicoccus algicola]MBE3638331.1 PAS domain-containing protein [Mangrovicoccus algicola]
MDGSTAGQAEDRDARTVIVGVGASAGGLEAFQDLFSRLQVGHRIAMVLVQHLDPDHESLLQDLLRKRTETPVQTITQDMEVEPGNIYLIPPGQALTIEDGILRLAGFDSPRGQRRPIDVFFESLARDRGDRAVGIVLSGTGSDGSNGIKAIKAAGGLVFAQDPGQSRYDGMPKSAIATGAVDLILRTEEMVDALADFFDRKSGLEPAIESDREFIDKVFKHVRYHTGHDFTHYKHSTLMRRLSLRMSVLGITSPTDYVKRLIQDRDEARRLIHDVLINVTGFFRDPEAWDRLRTAVLPQILKGRGRDEEVRIWVPGCSSGQEAYTMAMLLSEELSRVSAHPQVVIFGTDIDDEALAQARRGVYPASIIDEVPPNYLQSYFVPTAEGYEVGKALRNMVRFSYQSLIKDPPFSKLDLVSCRNLTIYFEPKLQKIAASVFHYALNPGGFLMLGLSENPTGVAERFEEFEPTTRIFRRDNQLSRPLDLPMGRLSQGLPRMGSDMTPPLSGATPRAMVERAILERHVPPYVVLNSSNAVSYASPGAEDYLRVPSGEQRYDLVSLAVESLASAVRRVLNHLDGEPADPASVEVTAEIRGELRRMVLTARRLPSGEKYLLFDHAGAGDAETVILTPAGGGWDDGYVRSLESELDDARQTIRSTVEELETSNEELKSSNEEMMSMNEELQSSNEELSTINEELQTNIAQLNAVNGDLAGFLESTGLPTVFLDDALNLRRFTPRALDFFRFADSDLGRPLEDIAAMVPTDDLLEGCRAALLTGQLDEMELSTHDGSHNLIARIAPSRHETGSASGVVFTLVDVTDLRSYASEAVTAREEAQRRLQEVEELYRASPIGMALFDLEHRFLRVNHTLAQLTGIPAEAHVGARLETVFPQAPEEVGAALERVARDGTSVIGMEMEAPPLSGDGGVRSWIVDFYPVTDEGRINSIGCNVRDISELRATEDQLRRIMLELQHRVKNMLANVKALINRAKRDRRDPQLVLRTLSERIDSMARTHGLLTAENWQSTRITELLRPELHDVYGAETISTHGPDLRLNARASLAIGLTVHELATNAAKYGALSEKGEHLDIRWMRVDDGEGDQLRLVWTETTKGGVEPPDGNGFGTTLIHAMIEGTLEGRIAFDWNDTGLTCTIEMPYDNATRIAPSPV